MASEFEGINHILLNARFPVIAKVCSKSNELRRNFMGDEERLYEVLLKDNGGEIYLELVGEDRDEMESMLEFGGIYEITQYRVDRATSNGQFGRHVLALILDDPKGIKVVDEDHPFYPIVSTVRCNVFPVNEYEKIRRPMRIRLRAIEKGWMTYKSCIIDNCWKKVVEVFEGVWYCSKCKADYETYLYRFLTDVHCTDLSNGENFKASVFDEGFRSLFVESAANYEERLEQDPQELNERLDDLCNVEYFVIVQMHRNTVIVDNRLTYPLRYTIEYFQAA